MFLSVARISWETETNPVSLNTLAANTLTEENDWFVFVRPQNTSHDGKELVWRLPEVCQHCLSRHWSFRYPSRWQLHRERALREWRQITLRSTRLVRGWQHSSLVIQRMGFRRMMLHDDFVLLRTRRYLYWDWAWKICKNDSIRKYIWMERIHYKGREGFLNNRGTSRLLHITQLHELHPIGQILGIRNLLQLPACGAYAVLPSLYYRLGRNINGTTRPMAKALSTMIAHQGHGNNNMRNVMRTFRGACRAATW